MAAVTVPSNAAAAAPALSCGATVTTSVTLTQDILNCPVDGLVVGASGITINLNGHKITGTSGAGPDNPDYCLCGVNDRGGYSRLTLRNGRIENFVFGSQFTGAHDIVVRNLTAAVFWEDAVSFDHVVSGLVADSLFLRSWRGVETLNSRAVMIRDTSTVDIGHAGIALKDTADSVVRDTAHNGSGDYGIELVNSSHNLVTHNQVRHWATDGIVVVGFKLFSTLITTGNSIIENDVRNGSSTGIELVEVGGGTVRDNLVSGNTIIGTLDTGILVDALTPADPNDPSGSCPCELLVGVGPSNNRIKDNTSNGNVLDGIHLYAPGNVIAGNVANRNGDWGIDAITGNIDGGGNRARGNGQAAQCRGVRCAP